MTRQTTAFVLVALMISASVAGVALRPETKRAGSAAVRLEATVPAQFGQWRAMADQSVAVVNPQTQELLDRLYSQVLTRTYVNANGYQVMLSMAYGDDQRGGLQAHRPEICYPAQGFKLQYSRKADITTSFGTIAGREMVATFGARNEPITYWFNVADQTVTSALEKRWVEFRLAVTGQVPDGLLFRISSIDADDARAFVQQRDFVNALLQSSSPDNRARLAGLRGAGS